MYVKLTEESIDEKIKSLLTDFSKDNFIYDLLASYGIPKSSITRLQKGGYNLSKQKNEVLWKKKLYFKRSFSKDLHPIIDDLNKNDKSIMYDPRFIIVSNYETFLAKDTKTNETLDIPLNDLPNHYDFFLPWAGKEKVKHKSESPADIKAAERMAKLYDAIKKDNPKQNNKTIHALNVFFSRILFCFFAEDTNIFEKGLFTNSIASHTEEKGCDLSCYLQKLFESLDEDAKSSYPKFLQKFPYVNGSLFSEKFPIPKFSRNSRKILLECGKLDWSSINPDIFGSMIQAVADPNQRGAMGMHYTSVSNIMKVIKPLFLNDLYNEFKKSINDIRKLKKLLKRIRKIKIFDPACGSGNFLIIAYKELRIFEMKIFESLQAITSQLSVPWSGISLSQFYGIEIDDFAHEVAILSLWIAEHQMNVEFIAKFGNARPSLPLNNGGKIVCYNAARLDWEEVCPKNKHSEIYILGNPPYLGARNQSESQKKDLNCTLGIIKGWNNLDYISCWFYKAAQYIIDTKSKFAFVSTNSISQGSQVPLLWPHILESRLEINFARQSFKWKNNAKSNAGVTCVIIGVRNCEKSPKYIYQENFEVTASNINPYLINSSNIFIKAPSKPIA